MANRASVTKLAGAAKGNKHLNGFLTFVREQGVIGIAVGLVIGGAAATLVKSLVDNVVMPPLGIVLGSADGLKGLSADLGVYNGKDVVMNYGMFLNDFVNFLIIAFVIYLVVHLLKADKLDKKKD